MLKLLSALGRTMSIESRLRAIVVEECGSVATQAYSIERGEVLMHRVAYGQEYRPDNRGIESAPYARHASPMARYQPMIRLLRDGDLDVLQPTRLERAGLREQRREIFNDYVKDLDRVAESLLKKHAEGGACSLDDLRGDTKCVRRCIARLRLQSWKHRLGFSGVPEAVSQALKDLTAALHLGELVEMPLPAQAIA